MQNYLHKTETVTELETEMMLKNYIETATEKIGKTV
jgi:hypothetical protein